MAGLGRRSHYRKHLTDAVLHDFPEPQEGECIAKVVATRGGNQFDIIVAFSKDRKLAILPTKFNKLVWLKRNDFVIVRTVDGEDTQESQQQNTGGIRFLITHILYKDQVKHLKSEKLWPEEAEFSAPESNDSAAAPGRKESAKDEEARTSEEEGDEEAEDVQADDDGIVYDNTDYDDEFFVNTNRLSALKIQDSESESSSEEE